MALTPDNPDSLSTFLAVSVHYRTVPLVTLVADECMCVCVSHTASVSGAEEDFISPLCVQNDQQKSLKSVHNCPYCDYKIVSLPFLTECMMCVHV